MTRDLFVYGTLRGDIRHAMHEVLARMAQPLGAARMQGRLFDLGEYPGLVPASGGDAWVVGEIHVLDRPDEALGILDDYEGCGANDPEPHEYERVTCEAILPSGESRTVWVYAYRGATSGLREIPSGDYLHDVRRLRTA